MDNNFDYDLNLLHQIKTFQSEDVITIFKTIDIDNPDNVDYIYNAMKNKELKLFIKEITTPYINKGIVNIFYEIIEGWMDFCTGKSNNDELKKVVSEILITIIHKDILDPDIYYINILNNEFNINYYAETMIG